MIASQSSPDRDLVVEGTRGSQQRGPRKSTEAFNRRPGSLQRLPKPLAGIREAPKRFSNEEPPQKDLRETGNGSQGQARAKMSERNEGIIVPSRFREVAFHQVRRPICILSIMAFLHAHSPTRILS